MTSMLERGSERRNERLSIVATCPSSQRPYSVSLWQQTPLNCADSPP